MRPAVCTALRLGLFASRGTRGVAGQIVSGGAETFEAVVMFPGVTGGNRAIFEEHMAFQEDKAAPGRAELPAGVRLPLDVLPPIERPPFAPAVFHTSPTSSMGAANRERFHVDVSLAFSRTTASFDVAEGDGTAHVGATDRDGSLDVSFRGFLD